MKALVINCTLKKCPEPSNTKALAAVVAVRVSDFQAEVGTVRAVDLDIAPGVVTDAGDGGEWPRVHHRLRELRIFIIASSASLGRPSSLAQRVLKRMDAMMAETDDVVNANEDGAHHVISKKPGAFADSGYTVPGQAWTYWHLGPGPGPEHLNAERCRDWAHSTGRTMADNLRGFSQALSERPLKALS
ncbi:flavodoxin family protein [Streptomyces olivochromogenes]|uniref:flavodoxin family protein n=1 Tax=Streptomyces olivochromogenes TaxID=1963 RepID=UPI001F44ADFC|nr:flavodoxin family protein [Streptomyces olivochromogenes]MCF3134172.1 NAD(P)H-dependent oxidoreductase [Streptomyces olivochromogenes]